MSNEPEIDDAFKRALEHVNLKFEDARMPTETERQSLARLMYLAFCDVRALSREGRTEQAYSLADAFHNVPLLMYQKDFSFIAFRHALVRYQEQYPGKLLTNYLQELEKLFFKKN